MRACLPAIGLTIVLLAVVGVRFDRQPVLPTGALWAEAASDASSDNENYAAYVSFFRGQGDRLKVGVPFLYRPLLPLLAAPIPLAPTTAIDLLDVLCLELALLLLLRRIAVLGFARREVWAGGALFALSFPTFYYGATGLVDPAAILLLTAGAASASSGKWLVTGLILAVGAVAKETTVILLPVAAVLLWFDKQRGRAPRLAVLAGLGLCFLLPFVVVRFLNRDVGSHLWLPHLWRIGHNLRPRALLSVLLKHRALVPAGRLLLQARRGIRLLAWLPIGGGTILLGASSLPLRPSLDLLTRTESKAPEALVLFGRHLLPKCHLWLRSAC